MSDDKDIDGSATNPQGGPDPLGIIGWDVAGKYKIKAYIGGGGFGEVYEGYNMHLPEQKLVLKFFKRVQSRDKFAKEAKILCMLDHPNISRVIDFLPEEGAVVVAFIDGEDGSVRLKKSGALDEETFLKVARAMTDAIAFAHEKRIAHRDLKPGNIMFDKSGHVYLIDFGIAKEMGGDATKTAYVALTPLFAAPERQSGEHDYNPFLSDVYEMGVTLFNFATNDLPYRNPANPNIQEWGGMASENISPELRRILMKATHPDPKQRYQTAREMSEDLKTLKQVYGGRKKKSAAPYYVAAVVILLALAGYYGRDRITGLYHQMTAKQEQVSESAKVKSEIDDALKNAADEAPPETTAAKDTVITAEVKKEEPVKETKPEPEKTVVVKPKEEIKPPVTKPSDTAKAVVEQKPKEADKKPVVAAPEEKPKEEPKKEPPPPSEYALTFAIEPDGAASVLINGSEGAVDSTYKVKPGSYNIAVIHPDYPIYRNQVRITDSNMKLSFDLGKEISLSDSVSMQISLNPPSDQHIIELSFNGRRHTLLEFPVWSMMKPRGEWQVEAGIFGISQDKQKKPRIDSVVVFPYGGGTHAAIKGARGKLVLGSAGGGKVESVPLLIFWSE
ncbi:MAG: hypothetical protein CVT49_00215 [candidate division Zixibacteria bacterium HGW-Zixibacteria-1]|nr:MAG: hypothetical protein CVT49_00215 [candidate division Zixibacteria bacterium HGW-Zixibacteria-1]